MKQANIPVFDGLTGHDSLEIHVDDAGIVRFLSPKGGVGVFHVESPLAAKLLRKLLKPLAKQA